MHEKKNNGLVKIIWFYTAITALLMNGCTTAGVNTTNQYINKKELSQEQEAALADYHALVIKDLSDRWEQFLDNHGEEQYGVGRATIYIGKEGKLLDHGITIFSGGSRFQQAVESVICDGEAYLEIPLLANKKWTSIGIEFIHNSTEKRVRINNGINEEIERRKQINSVKYFSYYNHIKQKINRIWKYPQEGTRKNQEGIVQVKITVQKSGKLSKVILLVSSGHKILDDNVIEAIWKADPFNPFPKKIENEKINIVGNFVYYPAY